MASMFGERAIDDALRFGNALLKILSPTDVGAASTNQAGYLLPIGAWEMFTPFGPEPGRLDKHSARVTWQDGRVTSSTITWYSSKNEYRLTGELSGDFPWRTVDDIGSLFVLIRRDAHEYLAYVLEQDEDIQDIQDSLGVELPAGQIWTSYISGAKTTPAPPDACIARRFRQFVASLTSFPPGDDFSRQTVETLRQCLNAFDTMRADVRLIRCFDSEYELFRMAERLLCGPLVTRLFGDVDEFLKTANTILNRRKRRAGRALENHIEYILRDAGIPFEMRPDIEGEPDVVIPGRAEYNDPMYPRNRLFVLGVKTTCRERWHQVLDEAPLVKRKHLLTLQKSVSPAQLQLMHTRRLTLVVPTSLHRTYPRMRPQGVLIGLHRFIQQVRTTLGQSHG